MSPNTARDLLAAYVDAHNAGVRTGDFEPMLALMSRDATFVLDGFGVGPFEGLRAIRAAFDRTPPTDELVVLATRNVEQSVEATYGWLRSPATGTLRVSVREGAIVRVVVRRHDTRDAGT